MQRAFMRVAGGELHVAVTNHNLKQERLPPIDVTAMILSPTNQTEEI